MIDIRQAKVEGYVAAAACYCCRGVLDHPLPLSRMMTMDMAAPATPAASVPSGPDDNGIIHR
jgi:hypothetical protein